MRGAFPFLAAHKRSLIRAPRLPAANIVSQLPFRICYSRMAHALSRYAELLIFSTRADGRIYGNMPSRLERKPKQGLQKTRARANPNRMLKKMPIHKSVLEQGTCQKRPQHCTRYRLPRAMPKRSKGSASSILRGTLITPKIQGHQLSKRLTFGKVKSARSS